MLNRKFYYWILLPFIAFFSINIDRAEAQYVIGIGDEIEVSIAGFPDLTRQSLVDMDGRIALPFGGHVKAAGLDLDTLRKQVQQTLSAKTHRRLASDGHNLPSLFLRDAVSLTIISYRPVYIKGDVANPGEQKFRPGMTVRMLIALAGGIGSQALRNPSLQISSLQSQYNVNWIEVAKQQALIRRVDAELASENKLRKQGGRRAPIDPKVQSKIESLEQTQLLERNAQFARQAGILGAAIKRSNSHLGLLIETQENNKKAIRISEEELNRINKLFRKGLSPISSLNDARRNSLLQSTRQLETLSQVALTERDRDQLRLQLERANGQRVLELLLERQNAEVELAKLWAKLRSLRDRLELLNALPRQPHLADANNLDIQIFRKLDGRTRRVSADQDTLIFPEDIVEVDQPETLFPWSQATTQ